ncbi:MAG: hypothetical protein AAGI68_17120 [Planctomycetota bacterium]
MLASLQTIHIPVMGFTQTTRNPTGQETLWRLLRSVSAPEHWVYSPLPWDTDPKAIAAHIVRNTAPDADINVYAYSWGAGWFLPRLARELHRWGRWINQAVLCDPVYRSPNPLLRGRSLLNRWWAPTIPIPHNVRELHIFRQAKNKPAGHRVRPDNPRLTTIVRDVHIDGLRHAEMDDLPAYHDLCLQLSQEITA